MKWLIRTFFKTIRAIIGPLILIGDKITTPKGIKRPSDEQQALDATTEKLALYQFKTCPFCIKTRRHIKRLSLKIELRDAQHNQDFRQQLESGGGKIKVPCLRIENADANPRWLFESNEIIKYLDSIASKS